MFTRIAVATDGSPTAMQAVQTASSLAAKYDSEVIVLHVLMWQEPTEILKRMAIVEHIFDGTSEHQIGHGEDLDRIILAELEYQQTETNEKLITILGHKLIEQAKDKCREHGVDSVEGEILEGDYADQIIAGTKRTNADLLVLGARGLGMVEGWLQGSVSQKVVRDVDTTCLIIK
jgi:nucleotide-binding universal stress UspA family protein